MIEVWGVFILKVFALSGSIFTLYTYEQREIKAQRFRRYSYYSQCDQQTIYLFILSRCWLRAMTRGPPPPQHNAKAKLLARLISRQIAIYSPNGRTAHTHTHKPPTSFSTFTPALIIRTHCSQRDIYVTFDFRCLGSTHI